MRKGYPPLKSLPPVVSLVFVASATASSADWSVQASTGTAHSFETRLSIRQEGFEALSLTASYETRPFEGAPYFAWRVARRTASGAWELQLLHHKLYLSNRPPEVARFDITHGYNVVTVGRSWGRGGWTLRAGAGVVFAHPESTVRGRRFGPKEGILGLDQYLTGPSAVVGVGREWRFGEHVFVSPEVVVSAARARVPLNGGEATAPNVAAHLLVGLGWRF